MKLYICQTKTSTSSKLIKDLLLKLRERWNHNFKFLNKMKDLSKVRWKHI